MEGAPGKETDCVCAAANLMKRKYRPQLITACIFMIFQQFDGINAIIVSPFSIQPREREHAQYTVLFI